MRYGFVNNFEQILAADLAAGATTMTLDGGGADLSAASADLVYTLTLDDGAGKVEIVHVTGASGNDLTIVRAQEGTTGQTWAVGTAVGLRLTAGIIAGCVRTDGNSTVSKGATVGAGVEWAVSIGDGASVAANEAMALGSASSAAGQFSSALGPYSGTTAAGVEGVAVGGGLVDANSGVSIGPYSFCYAEFGLAAGAYAAAYGTETFAAGYAAAVNNSASEGSMAAGAYAVVDNASFATSLGYESYGSADFGVSLGGHAENVIPGGFRLTALGYLPATPIANAATFPASAVPRASQQVVINTDALDLTDEAAAVTLDLPPNTMLFIDAIDVVITGSDTPGGSPEVTVGPDEVTPAVYLAATPVAKTAVGERETHSPLVADGVSSLRVATSTAGTGTTYQAKIVFRGYVMEL